MATDGDDDEYAQFASENEKENETEALPAVWKILVVDDEAAVRSITKLVLGEKKIFGRKLEFIEAEDSEGCRRAFREHDDIAVLLLDVVMETDDAGLRLAKWIREELGDREVRIILRTGQPGTAPETSVIIEYEINDYKEKTELSVDKLFSSVVTAIRGYRDPRRLKSSKQGMEMILDAAPSLFKIQSLKLFESGVLTQLTSLMSNTKSDTSFDLSGLAAHAKPGGFDVVAATGRFSALIKGEGEIPAAARQAMDRAVANGNAINEGNTFAACIEGPAGQRSVVLIEGCPPLDEIDLRLVGLFCTNVSSAFTNIMLFEDIQGALREKTALLAEIHHRVKNNLQVILSLISLAERDGNLSAMDTLSATRRRIAAMSIIHEHVYAPREGESIDFGSCIGEIVNEILEQRPPEQRTGGIRATSKDFVLSLEQAMPCALLVNELVTVGMLTAESGIGRQELELTLSGGEGEYRIRLEAKFPISRTRQDSNLAMHLLEALCMQLQGRIESDGGPEISSLSIVFPGIMAAPRH